MMKMMKRSSSSSSSSSSCFSLVSKQRPNKPVTCEQVGSAVTCQPAAASKTHLCLQGSKGHQRFREQEEKVSLVSTGNIVT